MADTKNAMNMGGIGGMAKKTRLVDDLNSAFKALNTTLEKTKKLSEGIAKDLKSAMGVNSGTASNPMSPDLSGTMGYLPQGTVKPGERSPSGYIQQAQPSAMSAIGGSIKDAAKSLAGAVVMASIQAISPSDYIENDISRRRAGFFMGATAANGAAAGSNVFQSMMIGGTATDKMDAARAVMNGASNGMMPGLANYGTISQSAQMFSNLVPGAGLEGGMQATTALNQASNVNRLRMIGIQVRDPSTGLMNSAESVANQIWAYLNKIKTGGGKITAQDISLSLQPGNSLDGMLNQYFGNDAVLRQGVIAALYQKAGGGTLSKSSLSSTGGLPAVATSFGDRYSAEYGATNAYTTSGVQGILDANSNIKDIANFFRDSVEAFGGYVKAITYGQTLSTGGNGGFGTIMGDVFSSVKDIGSTILSAIGLGKGAGFLKSLFTKGAGTAATAAADAAIGTEVAAGATMASTAASIAAPALAVGAPMALIATTAVEAGHNVRLQKRDRAYQDAAVMDATPGVPSWMGAAVREGSEFGVTKNWDGTPIKPKNIGDSSPLMNGLTIPTDGEFGNRSSFRTQPHRGVDFIAKTGTSVFAIRGGKVLKSGTEGDLGTMVRIQHSDGSRTVYGHLKSAMVSEGQTVAEGSQIALSGNSGRTTGEHLHVALENSAGGVSDPMTILGGAGAPSGGTNGVYSTNRLFQTSAGSLFNAGLPTSGGIGDSSPVMSSGGGTYYGGVTVNINVPQGAAVNETRLAQEVKRILQDDERLRMAVAR